MEAELAKLNSFVDELNAASSLKELQDVKVKYFGKKGLISVLNKSMKNLSAEERPVMGAKIHELRQEFDRLYSDLEAAMHSRAREEELASGGIDVTMPGLPLDVGAIHPITKTYYEIVDIFSSQGYEVVTGPEAELDFYNFEALNFPPNHPARDDHDTFYITDDVLLRTHTSPVQVRTMMNKKPPIKLIAPGKVYRNDYDVTHTPMFHQVEGLVVAEDITFGDLKGTLTSFVHKMFGEDVRVRFRSSFFPFTEPSAEVDMGCVLCDGSGCKVCGGSGWLEILGSGMVDPEVFKSSNVDPEIYSGFAFGMGIERIAMIKYGIDDLRLFFENNRKFLSQF